MLFLMNGQMKILLALGLNLLLTTRALAGPPFLTDDPEPTDYQHWENYLYATGNHQGGAYTLSGPAVGINYGVLPDTQLSASTGLTSVGGGGQPAASGLGDTQLSVKYRFLHETNGWLDAAIFPAVNLPTGDAARGLGNGRAWFQLPLWLQKDFGAWTTYGGGGLALNSAPGQRNYPFGGWLLQRDFSGRFSLGGEVFAQARNSDGDNGFVVLNFGGSCRLNENFSLLASAGHSIAGEEQTIWFFALEWQY